MDARMHGWMDGCPQSFQGPVPQGSLVPRAGQRLLHTGLFRGDRACWERTSGEGFKLKECQCTINTIRGFL